MGIRAFFAKPLASYVVGRHRKWMADPVTFQQSILQKLIHQARNTRYGRDHCFERINSYEAFKQHVPIINYEGMHAYIDDIIAGHKDVLWPGKPLYFAKTSGTTSGIKYIPITKESMPNHITGARDALLHYVHETKNYSFLDTQWMFLSGSPVLEKQGNIRTGRLSGIVNHHVPNYLRVNQKPTYATNCIDDWEKKLDAIIDETLASRMGCISGIPPWVQMYFDKIISRTGKKIIDIFPQFSVFVHGGVNFSPYRTKLLESIGKEVDEIELYPASEGFIAYQDRRNEEGMLLLLNSGIFFEFVPIEEWENESPTRLSIAQVEIGKRYSIIINSNAGLWGYALGDVVKFVSLSPPRVVVSGRVKHFISAFGEHVIGEEVEKAMRTAIWLHKVGVTEFSVVPQVTPSDKSLPHHEWLIEFSSPPENVQAFAQTLNDTMCELNIYYKDLIAGKVLQPLRVTSLRRNTFVDYMATMGKLGGQNKVVRLANDRLTAENILKIALKK